MQKFVSVIAAGVLSAAAFAGAASAENMNSAFANAARANAGYSDTATSASFGYQGSLGRVAGQNSGVRVLSLAELPKAEKADVLSRFHTQPEQVAALQSSIRSDAKVAGALADQNVSIQNVIATRTGLDGSVAYIVR